MGNLRQHFAFARNAVGHDDVEGGDAVGGDEQQTVAEIENLADLAAFHFLDSGQIKLENRFVWHGGNDYERFPECQVKLPSSKLQTKRSVRTR